MLLQSIPIPDLAIEKQKKRQVLSEEELSMKQFQAEGTKLMEVAPGHWVVQ